jgi:hypothetical protein
MDRREPRQQGHDQPGDHQQGRGRDPEPASESRHHRAQHDQEQDGLYTVHAADLARSVRQIGADQTSRRATASLYVTTAPVAVPADWNKRATFTTDE